MLEALAHPVGLTASSTADARPPVVRRQPSDIDQSASTSPVRSTTRGDDTAALSPQARAAALGQQASTPETNPATSAEQDQSQAASRAGRGGKEEQPSAQQSDPTGAGQPRKPSGEPLSDEEAKQVNELKQRDREVRNHEQAHKAAAGQYARGGPVYQYQQGPDGRRYAVGGHVSIDTAPVKGDPEATIQKMQVVQRAALAPAEPSSQDRAVAAHAARQAAQARVELQKQRQAEAAGRDEPAPSGPPGSHGAEAPKPDVSASVEAAGSTAPAMPARLNTSGRMLDIYA